MTLTAPLPESGFILNQGFLVQVGSGETTFSSNITQTATSASIGDYVWIDLNGDGVQDLDEVGLAGVEVCATPVPGETPTPVCATTDATGYYRIYGVTPGDYTVAYTPTTIPAGYLPTTPVTLAVTLAASQQYSDADFGLIPPGIGSIGDYIWLDKNSDGIQDVEEAPLEGIKVNLELWVVDTSPS